MNNKIHLNLEDLGVQSFDTTPESSAGRGTVFGRAGTWEPVDSCHATYCGDCEATNPDVDCGGDNSAQCDSVNIANCASAYYTDCCGGSGDRPTDEWGWEVGNCT